MTKKRTGNELDEYTVDEIALHVSALIDEDRRNYPNLETKNKEGRTVHEYRLICIAHRSKAMSPIFAMTVEDAIRLCSDSRTSWINSFAAMQSLAGTYSETTRIKFKNFIKDNGSMNEVIDEYGLRTIQSTEMRELFAPFGII